MPEILQDRVEIIDDHRMQKQLKKAWRLQVNFNKKHDPGMYDGLSDLSLLTTLRQTGWFNSLYDTCYSLVSEDYLDEDSFSKLLSAMAGRIHEIAGFHALNPLVSDDKHILLDYKRTFGVFRALYPHNKTTRSQINQVSLDGISVPDGLILTRGTHGLEVAEVVEYTLQDITREMPRKKHAFAILQHTYPVIFSGASLTFVSTFDQVVPRVSGVLTDFVPVSRSDYRSFMQHTLTHYLAPGRVATLIEARSHKFMSMPERIPYPVAVPAWFSD